MMAPRQVDVCIAGQGLAGTTLAWTFLLRGRRILVIDREEDVTASRIAAGLLTPVTGPKLAPTLFWNECRDVAEKFYRRIEAETGVSLFDVRPAVHLFRTSKERDLFQLRLQSDQFSRLAQPLPLEKLPPLCQALWGGFEMPTAGQLHVARYLDVSRKMFCNLGCFQSGEVHPASDICITANTVELPRWNVQTDKLIVCLGWTPQAAPGFEKVLFQPAKGEILTLRTPEFQDRRSVHSGCWLAPTLGDCSLLGSTFEWNRLDQVPTTAAREDLLARLKVWFRGGADVIDQRAAVRPTMKDFKPVLGMHPDQPRLGIMNGLGTKGSLMAPWLAEQFADHLDQQMPLPPDLDVNRWFR